MCNLSSAFHFTTTRKAVSLRHSSKVIRASQDIPAWVIDEDSSEVSCESSTELLRRREVEERKQKEAIAIKLQAQQKEQQNILQSVASMFKPTPQSPTSQSVVEIPTPTPTPAAIPKASIAPSVPTTSIPSSTQLSQNKSTAFDFGLLIAFPFIVGTLIVFLVFPILGPQLAKTLPPPMSY